MKRMLLAYTAVASVIMLLTSFTNTASAQPRTDISISYQTFYDELDPYGRWIDYPDQGYVWIPDAGPDFQPYRTSGHWVWADAYEWMWVSDYNWGWAPFHYGRWMHDPFYGWIWVPGYEWSPAWVAWRDGGDYYGWAPLRPGITIGINFSLGGYNPPIDYWSFAPRRYITSPRIYDYCAPRRNNVTIINQTTIINNYNYNRNVFRTGPGRRDAERYAGRIRPVRLRESNSPGRTRFRNNEVSVYRPQVKQNAGPAIAPRKFERADRNRSTGNGAISRNANKLPQPRQRTIDERRDRTVADRNNIKPQKNADQQNNMNRERVRRNTPSRPADNGAADRRREIITNRNAAENRERNRVENNRRLENRGTMNRTREARPPERNSRANSEVRQARPERRSIERPRNNTRPMERQRPDASRKRR